MKKKCFQKEINELNTCDLWFSTNYRIINIQQQGETWDETKLLRSIQQQCETWDETKLLILDTKIMADTPISLTYVHSLYLEPWNGNVIRKVSLIYIRDEQILLVWSYECDKMYWLTLATTRYGSHVCLPYMM